MIVLVAVSVKLEVENRVIIINEFNLKNDSRCLISSIEEDLYPKD